MKEFTFYGFTASEAGLWEGGARIRVEPQVLTTLLVLIRNRDSVVSRDDIEKAIRGSDMVTRHSLDRTIALLRRIFRDSVRESRFIRTLPHTGYHFIAPVAIRTLEFDEASTSNEARNGKDCSRFIRDVSIPDGTRVRVNQVFIKRWELQNVGEVEWANRYLARLGPHNDKRRLRSPARVRIPHTAPGQCCIITVRLVAPSAPASCRAHWKMIDESGHFYFPMTRSIWVDVDVDE